MSISNVKLTLSWQAHVNELWNIDIELKSSCQRVRWVDNELKAHVNKPCYIDIKLKSLCQWAMQRWHYIEKLMLISYAMLTVSWKAHVNKLCKVDNELKSLCQ